jgi:integrase
MQLAVNHQFVAPDGAILDRVAPLLQVAEAITASVPVSSGAKIRAAVNLWCNALQWFGVSQDNITVSIPIALLVARCCPPVGLELPTFLKRRVLPVTAAADIDSMRRAATLNVIGMEGALPALADYRVLALQKAIGGRARRITTSKCPLLFHEVELFWQRSEKAYHLEHAAAGDNAKAFTIVRDAFAVVLAFAAATRVSELLQLQGEHIQVDEDGVIILTFVSVKNRRSLFTTHQPFKVALRLPLLLRSFDLFNRVCGFSDNTPIFHRVSGKTRDPLSRDWFDRVIKSINPSCSPHSVRVGAATELWAAEVPITSIMALGRWTSAAAVIYVIGCLDVTIEASARLGSANVKFVRGDLRKRIGVSDTLSPWTVERNGTTSTDDWLGHCAATESEP